MEIPMCKVIHHDIIYHSENLGPSYVLSNKGISEMNYCRDKKLLLYSHCKLYCGTLLTWKDLFQKASYRYYGYRHYDPIIE